METTQTDYPICTACAHRASAHLYARTIRGNTPCAYAQCGCTHLKKQDESSSTMVCSAYDDQALNATQALLFWSAHTEHALFVSRIGGYVVCPQGEMWKYREPIWAITSPEGIEEILRS